jgi:phosphocarrier protein
VSAGDGPETSEEVVEIVNELGLHARAATKFVQLAARFPCDVDLEKEEQWVNGKSIMGVLMLVASKGSMIRIRCKGDRSAECLAALLELVRGKFGEGK